MTRVSGVEEALLSLLLLASSLPTRSSPDFHLDSLDHDFMDGIAELSDGLHAAADPGNRRLLVTFANYNHLPFALNWRAHVSDLGIECYLIGAMDDETYDETHDDMPPLGPPADLPSRGELIFVIAPTKLD